MSFTLLIIRSPARQLPGADRIHERDLQNVQAHRQPTKNGYDFGAFDLHPVDRDLVDVHAQPLHQVDQLDVERPAFDVCQVEQTNGQVAFEQFEAALSVAHRSDGEEPDDEVEAVHEQRPEETS